MPVQRGRNNVLDKWAGAHLSSKFLEFGVYLTSQHYYAIINACERVGCNRPARSV